MYKFGKLCETKLALVNEYNYIDINYQLFDESMNSISFVKINKNI